MSLKLALQCSELGHKVRNCVVGGSKGVLDRPFNCSGVSTMSMADEKWLSRLTEAFILEILCYELSALFRLLGQLRHDDSMRLDFLKRFSFVEEAEGIAHGLDQAFNADITTHLLDDYLLYEVWF